MPHRCRFYRVLSLLLLAVLVLPVFSKTLSVQASLSQRYFAASSPGSEADCTYSNPCSLQAAVDMASDGDIIYADWGSHRGSGSNPVLHITKDVQIFGGWSGMMDDALEPIMYDYFAIIDGENTRRPILIDGNASPTLNNIVILYGFIDGGNGGGVAILNTTGGHVTFNHCDFEFNNSNAFGGAIYVHGGTVTIRNSYIGQNTAGHGGGGIMAAQGSSVFIENTTLNLNSAIFGAAGHFEGALLTAKSNRVIDNYGWSTITINGKLNQPVIMENNIIAGNSGAAVEIGSSDGLLISFLHNTLFNNNGNGLSLPNNTTGQITNNIFQRHKFDSIYYIGTGSTAKVSHNLFWQNGSNPNKGTNAIEADALLNNSSLLTYGSPAINAGTGSNITVDIDGQLRPLGQPDIGADEFSLPLYIPTTMR